MWEEGVVNQRAGKGRGKDGILSSYLVVREGDNLTFHDDESMLPLLYSQNMSGSDTQYGFRSTT
jgi:hypothetical protein